MQLYMYRDYESCTLNWSLSEFKLYEMYPIPLIMLWETVAKHSIYSRFTYFVQSFYYYYCYYYYYSSLLITCKCISSIGQMIKSVCVIERVDESINGQI